MPAKAKYREWLTEDGLLLLTAWARDGLTDEQIAAKCGCSVRSLYAWKAARPEIAEALRRGKEPVDIEVENSLLRRAMGYDYEEVTRERAFDPETGRAQMVEVKRVRRHMPPDVTAQIFWLKNRRPDLWRDRREVGADVAAEIGIVLGDAEELSV